jgi:hypothetical protein
MTELGATGSADSAVRSAARRIIPLLAVGYIISYIDRSNVGFAALTMNRDLGLTATQFGFAAGTFYFGYCLLEVPSCIALRHYGARRWLARIMITWGLAAAGTSLAVGPVSFSAFRFLTGACEAGFYPGVMFYLSTWFPVNVRARAFAWFNVANPMSSVISGPVSASLLKLNGFGGLAGWKWLLLCEGLPACVLGFYTWYALPDRPSTARWLTNEQKQALEARLAEETHAEAAHDLWAALRDPRVMILSFFLFLPHRRRFGRDPLAAANAASTRTIDDRDRIHVGNPLPGREHRHAPVVPANGPHARFPRQLCGCLCACCRRLCFVGRRQLVADHDRRNYSRSCGHERVPPRSIQPVPGISAGCGCRGRYSAGELDRQPWRILRPLHDGVAERCDRLVHGGALRTSRHADARRHYGAAHSRVQRFPACGEGVGQPVNLVEIARPKTKLL